MKIIELLEDINLSQYTSENAKKFIDKVYSLYPANPFNTQQFYMVFGTEDNQQIVMIELTDYPYQKDTVEIKWIQAVPSKGGAGTKAINKLQELAKIDNITLALYPWDKGTDMKQKDLKNFYKKLGFKSVRGSNEMFWKSNES